MPVALEPVHPRAVSRRNRKWLKISLAVFFAGAVFVAIVSSYAGRIVRHHLVDALETHYHSRIELKDFSVLVFPRVHISGEGLVMRQDADPHAPPFIKVAKFSTDASLVDLLRHKKRIANVTLEGLEIHIVHRDQPQGQQAQGQSKGKKIPEFVIEKLSADETKLFVHPRDPKAQPREFDIHQLSLRSAGPGEAMKYKATVTNPTPPGKIESSGYFGPLNVDDPGKSPLKGDYTFRNADLGSFKGISGTLSSDGQFSGVLDRIDVKGNADVPNFAVGKGHSVHLATEFAAVVDGTDGDTYLHEVKAHFLNTNLLCSGKIEGTPGVPGKKITLKADAQYARVEDLLALVVNSSEPPLTGEAEFHAQFQLPQGDGAVLDRIQLMGAFGLENAKFSKASIQRKIAKLSTRAKGDASNNFSAQSTVSDFAGHFTLQNGKATFSQLSFFVPGASVNLHGTYNLDSQALDFHGDLHLQAELSRMTTGVKSFFARLIQPLFSGGKGKGKTDIPIKITGTRSKPDFGLDTRRLF